MRVKTRAEIREQYETDARNHLVTLGDAEFTMREATIEMIADSGAIEPGDYGYDSVYQDVRRALKYVSKEYVDGARRVRWVGSNRNGEGVYRLATALTHEQLSLLRERDALSIQGLLSYDAELIRLDAAKTGMDVGTMPGRPQVGDRLAARVVRLEITTGARFGGPPSSFSDRSCPYIPPWLNSGQLLQLPGSSFFWLL